MPLAGVLADAANRPVGLVVLGAALWPVLPTLGAFVAARRRPLLALGLAALAQIGILGGITASLGGILWLARGY